MAEEKKTHQLNDDTYEIIRGRLQKHAGSLQKRVSKLNTQRQEVFGALETKLIDNNRILTENNCIPRDIVSFNETCIFGYNVHFGLRSEINLSDVFSIYEFKDNHFEVQSLNFIKDAQFETDFVNLYKYYRNTFFTRFAVIGNFLYMVFQISEKHDDIKTFKWLIKDHQLTYVDSRSEHEYSLPPQHEFQWKEVTRDMHRYGEHPHVSVADKVFVETIKGDLTIKIEDNTSDGIGIYSEDVEYRDQTLDDGKIRFSEFGNLIPIEITPFQETPRYFLYNHKMQEVQRIDSLSHTAVFLPDEQGLIFPTGYYLQTGEYHLFDNQIEGIEFVRKVASPNGEDYLYVFYSSALGLYNLLHYNVISQKVKTPILCNGYTIFKEGQLCYFRNEEEQTKHHLIQIWQTPFTKEVITPTEHADSMIYKIGNKDIVKFMAEAQGIINLLNKGDNYENLYVDIAKNTKNILDSYYWLNEEETMQLDEPITAIRETAHAAIDEFERVVQLRKNALKEGEKINKKAQEVFGKIKSTSFKSIDEFVQFLTALRGIRGEVITLRQVQYIDLDQLEKIEQEVEEYQDKLSKRCVEFLLDKKALKPYEEKLDEKEKALEKGKKVFEIKELEADVQNIASELELLIEIVSNLEIEDTTHSTQIIDAISLIYARLNQLKAAAKNKKQDLGSQEAKAGFATQIKLIQQSVNNYFDMANTPEKCDEYQNKVAVQLEDLEAKFIDYDNFTLEIAEKREEIFASFDNRKSELTEKKNRRAVALQSTSERIIKGIVNKLKKIESEQEINAYFASDLMVNKVRDNTKELIELGDQGKAESLETSLKVAKEDAFRQLKDRNELYEEGNSVIKFGKHRFGVNQQNLEVSLVLKNKELYYHITATEFYQPLKNDVLEEGRRFWTQDYVSENKEVYRSEYLAYSIFKQQDELGLLTKSDWAELIKSESSTNYAEGYTKGVHDEDALSILLCLVDKHQTLALLSIHTRLRAHAQFFWHSLEKSTQLRFLRLIKTTGQVFKTFPTSPKDNFVEKELQDAISLFAEEHQLFNTTEKEEIANYLVKELQSDDVFVISIEAFEFNEAFQKLLKEQKQDKRYLVTLEETESLKEKIQMAEQWFLAFQNSNPQPNPEYLEEAVCLSLFAESFNQPETHLSAKETLTGLKGSHQLIQKGKYEFDYHLFIKKLGAYTKKEAPQFLKFRAARHEVLEDLKEELMLDKFIPNVLSSFVRNKLIDEVYLPLFGSNLAKQIGTVGENKRVDRSGMLLLISPPGYGKTTLMEYICNRLGLTFMKINGPAIGHDITSVDPASATNSASKEELKKLNLAFEMGNNVMLYLDDIQHCNPEFLQKFISLSDGTRRIEGVYNGKPKTYDLRGKKFCVIMAGNPYTETGERFKIPDMLVNRADIYNLGDIIGETKELFELSLIENALTSNSTLTKLRNSSMDDLYALISQIETGRQAELKAGHSQQDIQEYVAVLEKVIKVRNTVLRVNETYIKSAAMEDAYRIEPAFKLQGSYRDMSKLVEKIISIMNEKELESLLLTHYESESQTLTSQAEANLLKYKELSKTLTSEEEERWNEIKKTFVKNNKIKGLANTNEMGQIIAQLMDFNSNLGDIQKALLGNREKEK